MKKIKYLLLMLCVVLMLSGCAQEKPDEERVVNTPLLYEVTKEGSQNKLYLFGSIHVGDDSMYPLPNYVMDAYHESEKVAAEFDLVEYENNINISEQLILLSKFMLKDGLKIKDVIGEELYNQGVDILKNIDLYSPLYDSYNPMMWYTLLENAGTLESGLDSELGIDKHILNLAKEDNKDILELESAEFQLEMLLGFDLDIQTYMLKSSIVEYQESIDNIKELYELYKEGDYGKLIEFLTETDSEPNQYDIEFNNKLITERNIKMFEKLEESFVNGDNVFCTVGLAHIIADGGIASLFGKNGYNVREVNTDTMLYFAVE